MRTADQGAYLRQARTIRADGLSGFSKLARRYLETPDEQQYPSPLRWLWIALLAMTVRAPLLVPVAAMALLPLATMWAFGVGWPVLFAVGCSPLVAILCRSVLQDTLVALLTVVAMGFALRADPLWLAVTLFALLAVKEVSPLCWPVVAVVWQGGWLEFCAVVSAATLVWLSLTTMLLGNRTAQVVAVALRSHRTEYTKNYQRGGFHRLVIDLALLSPLALFFAIWGSWPLFGLAMVLLLAHSIGPVQNIRTVLAADVLLRCAAVMVSPWLLVPMVALDVWLIVRTLDVYDPTTQSLTSALGMAPKT